MSNTDADKTTSDHHVQPFFAAWARFVLRHRLPLLALTVLLTAGAVYQVKTKLQIKASLETFLSADSETHATLEAFRENFGRDDVFLVLASGDVFSIEFLDYREEAANLRGRLGDDQ